MADGELAETRARGALRGEQHIPLGFAQKQYRGHHLRRHTTQRAACESHWYAVHGQLGSTLSCTAEQLQTSPHSQHFVHPTACRPQAR